MTGSRRVSSSMFSCRQLKVPRLLSVSKFSNPVPAGGQTLLNLGIANPRMSSLMYPSESKFTIEFEIDPMKLSLKPPDFFSSPLTSYVQISGVPYRQNPQHFTPAKKGKMRSLWRRPSANEPCKEMPGPWAHSRSVQSYCWLKQACSYAYRSSNSVWTALSAFISSSTYEASSQGRSLKKTPLKEKPSVHLTLFVFGNLQVKIVLGFAVSPG